MQNLQYNLWLEVPLFPDWEENGNKKQKQLQHDLMFTEGAQYYLVYPFWV